MKTEEKVADTRIVVNHPITQDVVFVYKIRYTSIRTFDDDERLIETRWRSEYGGMNEDMWHEMNEDVCHEFRGYDVLDMFAPGVLRFDGLSWMAFRAAIKELDEQEKSALETTYVELGHALYGAKT